MIQSLERAFAILQLLDQQEPAAEGLGAQDVATRMGLKFPTAHSFLKSLVELGYLERVPTSGKYRVSAKLARLGNRQGRLKALEAIATREIEGLAERFHETVSLSLEVDYQRQGLVLSESTQELRVVQRHGDGTFYPYPVGRVHLSRMGPARLDAFVAERGLPTGEWPGVTTREELDAALERIRREGLRGEAQRSDRGRRLGCARPRTGRGAERRPLPGPALAPLRRGQVPRDHSRLAGIRPEDHDGDAGAVTAAGSSTPTGTGESSCIH